MKKTVRKKKKGVKASPTPKGDPRQQNVWLFTYRVFTAESGHFLADVFVDVALLVEQLLQLVVLVLEVRHFQRQSVRLVFIVFILLPPLVLQNSAVNELNFCYR